MRDVVAEREKSKLIYFCKTVLGLGVCVLGLVSSGCNSQSAIETFCAEIPEAQAEVTAMRAQIVAYVPNPATRGAGKRSPASVKASQSAPSEETQAEWLEWTEDTLKRTQWARDKIEDEKGVRKSLLVLNEATLSLVSIHGYIEQKKWKKVGVELDKFNQSLKRAADHACAAPVADKSTPKRSPASAKSASKKKKK
jgi:hypothetical protein